MLENDERKTLEDGLKELDPGAQLLVREGGFEWVRSRIGIIGLIRLDREANGIGEQLARSIATAHAALDRLSLPLFSADDVWNLLLLIRLPWSKKGFAALPNHSELAEDLDEISGDLRGSRKMLLWNDMTLRDALGPLTPSVSTSEGAEDPLRVEIRRVSRNSIEEEALQLIFSKRITDSDVDHLIEALTLEPAK